MFSHKVPFISIRKLIKIDSGFKEKTTPHLIKLRTWTTSKIKDYVYSTYRRICRYKIFLLKSPLNFLYIIIVRINSSPVHFSKWEMQAYLLIELGEMFIAPVEYRGRGLSLSVNAQRVHVVLFRIIALFVAETLYADDTTFLGHAATDTIFFIILK